MALDSKSTGRHTISVTQFEIYENLRIKETFNIIFMSTSRSLDDVRMNLEVLKHCATVLFLVFINIFSIMSDLMLKILIDDSMTPKNDVIFIGIKPSKCPARKVA